MLNKSSIDHISANHICTKQISELQETTLDNLKIGIINYGKILYCQSFTLPCKATAIVSGVHDLQKTGYIQLSLYNIVSPTENHAKIESKYCQGFKFAIKEPYVKIHNADLMVVGMRIDNTHSNFIFFDDYWSFVTFFFFFWIETHTHRQRHRHTHTHRQKTDTTCKTYKTTNKN